MTRMQRLFPLAVAILVFILNHMVPNVIPAYISYPIVGLCMVYLIAAEFGSARIFLRSFKYVPMKEAATKAYEMLRASGSNWARTADWFAENGLGETPTAGVLIYVANAFATNMVPIYGKHPPSRKYECIDSKEFTKGIFGDQGATFFYHGAKIAEYVDIAVKRADLKKEIKRMKGPRYAK
jgi:hypothetical protein